MKTKALLLTVALGAASAATSMAQVYSQNAVGYINVPILSGFNLISAQLATADRSIGALIPTAPDATTAFIYTPGVGFSIQTYIDGAGWDPNPAVQIPMGGGLWIQAPSAFTITFVGEVPQGNLSTPVASGFSIVSSQVPQSGGITSALGFPGKDSDTCFKYVAGPGAHFEISTYIDGAGWDPVEPILSVGDAVWIQSAGVHANWTRTFSVN
jgi:hypothetical protein